MNTIVEGDLGDFGRDPMFVDASDPDGADNAYGTADDGLQLLAGSPPAVVKWPPT